MFILFITSTSSIIVSKSITNSQNVIYIDPGHGGADGGGVGKDGTYEKEIVLEISFKLRELLSQAGYNVILTRNGDYDLASPGSKNRKREDIHKRVAMINNSNCLLYVSIHANIYPSSQVFGAQVFYNNKSPESKELSENVQDTIKSLLQNTKRVAKSISGKYLVDHVNKTGCLVEVGFLTNYNEFQQLKDPSYQEKMAFAIYIGICSFLENN